MSHDNSQIKKISTFYSETAVLRALISSIPIVGTYLDLTLSMPGQKFVEERLEYLISELGKELENVKDMIVDNTFLQTEEGYDLIIKTFGAAAKTRQKKKLTIFAQILRGAYTHKESIHDPELYVRIVDELSIRELEIAFLLYKIKVEKSIVRKEGDTGNDIQFISNRFTDFSKDELEFILPRLEKTGLIKELVGTFIGYGGGTYNATPLLSSFMRYIEDNK